MVLWYHVRPRVVPWYCQGRKRVRGAILSIANAYTSHPGANAEGRTQNAEVKATPMRHQCDIKATSMRVASQAVATLKPPPCDLNASLMRPQGSHKAPTKPPRGECRRINAECRMAGSSTTGPANGQGSAFPKAFHFVLFVSFVVATAVFRLRLPGAPPASHNARKHSHRNALAAMSRRNWAPSNRIVSAAA
jgi:hypothetical protein